MNQYDNPADRFLSIIFVISTIIPATPLVISFFYPSGFYSRIFLILITLSLISLCIYLAIRLILLRPIKIQINESGMILFYHLSQPQNVSWNDIEWIVKFEGNNHTLLGRIDHGGKIKLRNQSWPFYSSYEVASAITGTYKGPGQLKKVGNAWIIE